MYDYMAAMRQDIKEYIKENKEALQGLTREEAEEKLYDDMWTADSVTGNASGSYTFSRARAKSMSLAAPTCSRKPTRNLAASPSLQNISLMITGKSWM